MCSLCVGFILDIDTWNGNVFLVKVDRIHFFKYIILIPCTPSQFLVTTVSRNLKKRTREFIYKENKKGRHNHVSFKQLWSHSMEKQILIFEFIRQTTAYSQTIPNILGWISFCFFREFDPCCDLITIFNLTVWTLNILCFGIPPRLRMC